MRYSRVFVRRMLGEKVFDVRSLLGVVRRILLGEMRGIRLS